MKKILSVFILLLSALPIISLPSIQGGAGGGSVAGLFPLENSGRLVWNFNAGWRFHLGDIAGAEAKDFDDTSWEVVSTPHTVQLMPAEASGCRNYQGIAWYRKHFRLPKECAGRDVTLHFEAIMGKQTIYVNGQKVKEHEGGYLPITIPLTDGSSLSAGSVGDDFVVAICADNSDDKTYPPGKKQMTLDFAYHGGIYRDVWLIAKNKVAITDALEENKVSGGGIFVHYANISDKSAEVFVNTEVHNTDTRPRTITVENALSFATQSQNTNGSVSSAAIPSQHTKLTLASGEARTVTQRFLVKNPRLWSPESPFLYSIATRIKEGKQSLDGGITRIGIRPSSSAEQPLFPTVFRRAPPASTSMASATTSSSAPTVTRTSPTWATPCQTRNNGATPNDCVMPVLRLSVPPTIRKTRRLWMPAMNWDSSSS